MPRPPDPDKIPITSPAQLRIEFDSLQAALALEETEHTWEKIDKAVKRFQAVVRGGAGKKELADEYVRGMRDKTLANGLIRSLATERTRLSGSTLDLIGSSTRLGPQFAPLLPLYLPTLLRLLCRTNKLYINRSTTTITSIVKNTKLVDVLRFVVAEWQGESGKSASFREKATEITTYILSSGPGGELQITKDVLDRRIEELEWIIKTAAVDKDVKVRAEAKKCWEVYRKEWPDRVASFTSPMTPTIRRYLNVNASSSETTSSSKGPALVKKPRVPSALASSVSHAAPHSAATSAPARTASALNRSVGAGSRPLPSSSATRGPAVSATVPAINPSSRSALKNSVGMGPPPRTTRGDPSARTASNPSSRSVSRNEDRPRDLSSSASHHSSVTTATSSTTVASASSFRPTTAVRAGTSSAPPFKPAIRTGAVTANAPAAEPRRARRVAPPTATAPEPATLPISVLPNPATSASSNLSRSTSSNFTRSNTAPTVGANRPVPPTLSTSAPFRPHKPTAATTMSKSSARAPVTSTSLSTRSGASARPVTASGVSKSTVKAAPPTSTLAARARREKESVAEQERKKEEERKAAAAEIAALEAAAVKRRILEKAESEAEDLRLREEAERAKEVPLPIEDEQDEVEEVEEEEEEDSEEETEEVEETEEEEVAEAEEEAKEGEDEQEEASTAEAIEVPEQQDEAEALASIEEAQTAEQYESGTEQRQAEANITVAPELRDASGSKHEESADRDELSMEVDHTAWEESHRDDVTGPEMERKDPMEQDEDEDMDCASPTVNEIRLVGDLPPSPFLQETSEQERPSMLSTSAPSEDSENADLSTDSTATLAPADTAPSHIQRSPPFLDVSIALDNLALTTDASERSLLADTTLPPSPSPLVASTPCPARVVATAPSPVLSLSDDDCFPMVQQAPGFHLTAPLSPESCQTASIVLETPPRLDESPAQLRLPGRPVVTLNFPGGPRNTIETTRHAEPDRLGQTEDHASEIEEVEDVDSDDSDSEEDESEAPSPSRRPTSQRPMIPPPTPLQSRSRQQQPIFFPESASYTDVDTSFEEDEVTEDEHTDASRSFSVPLNDAQNSADYDDSDLGEEQETPGGLEENEEEQGTPRAVGKAEHDLDEADLEPATHDSVPHDDDDEGSRVELEQPDLRFYDETESEPEVTLDGVEDELTSEYDESVVSQEPPTILKRSLRSRVVTVDLQAAKTPARSSRSILSEMQS